MSVRRNTMCAARLRFFLLAPFSQNSFPEILVMVASNALNSNRVKKGRENRPGNLRSYLPETRFSINNSESRSEIQSFVSFTRAMHIKRVYI